MELKQTWIRQHRNGMLATVDRFDTGGESVFSGGAIPVNGTGTLKFGLRDLQTARAYADADARKDGHTCTAECGAWDESRDAS